MTPKTSAAERAYRIIKTKIVALEFLPGAPASEVQLASDIGVSRTPIREALLQLSKEGLVDYRSRAGTVVAPIRLDSVKAAHFVREKLETAIIREAATAHSSRFQFSLNQAIEEQKFAVQENDPDLFFASDERMHQSFAVTAGYPQVWPIILDAKTHLDRLRRLTLRHIELGQVLAEHIELQRALLDRDADAAEAIMSDHVSKVLSMLDELIARFPDYFESNQLQEGEKS